MNTFIEILYKAADKITFGWSPEALTGISGYNVYVGQVSIPGSLTKIVSNVAPQSSNSSQSYRKVTCDVTATMVQALLGLPSTSDFSNLLLYFAITYISGSGESSIASSTVVEVPPVGVNGKTMREDPSVNRHLYGFSDEMQRWVKAAGTGRGALIVDSCDFYKANMITEYTRDGTGNVLTEKVYFSDRTTSGSPAKLVTYSYSGGYINRVAVSDSTV
jgi:hypothetical protein